MAVYNFVDGSITGGQTAAQVNYIEKDIVVYRKIVDLSLQTLDADDGDSAQVLAIPAGVTIMNAFIRIITAETTNGTLDLGITGVNVDQWGAALAMDSTAGSIVGGVLAAPYYFATADTIDVLATTDTADVDLDGAKFEVIAWGIVH
mgnify:CR=1 FL=1